MRVIKKLIIIIGLISLLTQPIPCQAKLSPIKRIKSWVTSYKESRIQPLIYAYYDFDSWKIYIGIKIKF